MSEIMIKLARACAIESVIKDKN